MAIIPTTKGKIYAVVTEQGCTVSTGTGIVICSVEAGAQGYFVAPSNEVTVSDDAALVTATFKCALRTLRLLAGGSKLLPSGYTTISYLENAIANQGIYTNVFSIDAKIVEIKAQPKNMQDVLFGQMPYVDGTRYYATMGWESALGEHLLNARSPNRLVQYWQPDLDFFIGSPRVYRFNTVDKTLTVDNIEGLIKSYAHTNKFNYLPFALLGLTYVKTDLTYYIQSRVGTRCYYFKLSSAAGELEANYLPCLDASGKPCMFDTVSKQAFYNAGTGDFIAGIDATAQIKTLLRNLPDLTGQEAKTLQIRLADSIRTEELEAYITNEGNNKNWLISHAA